VGEKSELKLENLDVNATKLLAFLRSLQALLLLLLSRCSWRLLTLVSLLLLASFPLDGTRADSSNILYASVLLMFTPALASVAAVVGEPQDLPFLASLMLLIYCLLYYWAPCHHRSPCCCC
jgi:hypothetical protein